MKSTFKKIISTIVQFEANLVLKKYKPKIIAVTGSVGKTSTKDAIFSVLSDSFHIRKSEKSFNSDIGIPLTILGVQNAWSNPVTWLKNIFVGIGLLIFRYDYPKWLVLEVGADRPKDIKNITRWLKPDIAVLTAFAEVPVHVEFFGSRDEVVREKRYLAEALKKDGILIVNGDDVDSMRIKESLKNRSIVYGTSENADLMASDYKIYYDKNGKPEGNTYKVEYNENSLPVVIKGSLGIQNMYSSLAGLAVALSQKINLIDASQAFLNHETPKGRMRIIDGIKDITILDDTYNSSPVAASQALKTLGEINSKGRKIAALGDMMELGKHSVEEHYKIGKLINEYADVLITVGIRSRKVAEGALETGMDKKKIFSFDNSIEARDKINDLIKKNDIILVKGSQSVRMERIVKEIMLDKEKASELLVRQDEEWKNR
jgi:UDP-N-acetylmuramoyl-tripeptide--D-alanyl-D-alanine ligase